MSDTKTITIKIRVDSKTFAEMQSRADTYTKGNLSALVRCATLSFKGNQPESRDNPRVAALLSSAIKQIGRLGTNANQVTRHINEQQKYMPYSLGVADLLPFSQYREEIERIQQMLTHLYNMMKSI